ncbi:MAG: phosphoribosyltransferase, partial [Candidatus Freyarchaeota archaeon]|nr:phosphoribosyltransferase [Candidatus Jordarchaeia archaeon]
ADMILRDGLSFDVIVGIARGGWVVARMMSDLLSVRHVGSVAVEFYSNVGERMKEPAVTQPLSTDVAGRSVLLCDDVADSGHSLRVVIGHLKERGVGALKVATLHLKPWSVVTPDYYGDVTDAWVIYPWELFESIESVYRKLEEEGMEEHEIKQFLVNIPIPLKYLDPLLEWKRKVRGGSR